MKADAVWLLDSDGQFDPDDLGKLMPHYGADRLVAGFRIHRSDPTMRRVNNAAFRVVARAFAELWRFRRDPSLLNGLASPER